MEAVPKLPLINFELKSSPENTHFGPKLKQYIAEAYREDPDSYSNEMHQLEGLRSAAVRPSIDATGLSALIRYFCQLRAMQSRFPMAKGQPAACTFAWKDLYANMSCSLADIRFEMACILYNIGALHTQLGSSEPRTSADSLKAACTHYQNAAWAFQYLREQYPQPPGVDVSTEIMRLLQEICFAQAQECILEKSIQDTRKPSVIGAVATQVMFFYKNSLALLGPSTGTDNIHEIIGTRLYNYWHHFLSFKSFYIGCIVCLYQGMNAEEQQKMGERVAFYQQAVDKLGEARKLAKYIEPTQITQEALTFTNDVVEGKRKAAKNENEFIYHEEVPDKDLLMDLKPVCLVKAQAINFNDPEVSGPDIFSRLVPMGAHEASSMYSEEKAKLLRHIVSQVEMKNTELTEFMSSLQLDQLEVLDSDQKIPQEIVDRCAAMNAKTEIIQTLVDSMNNLAEIISDVEHSLAEIKGLIQEETMKEKEYQKTMGPRPPSIVQTELSREYHKYQEAHTRTNESNQVLHKAMTLHIANLRLLSQPLDVLQNKIPSIDNIEGLDRDTMTEMRRVVGKAREMQTQRDSLVQQLREAVAGDDITAQLLARSTEPTDEIFKQEIEKHTPRLKIIEQNLTAQENIINKLTSLYASYGDSRRLLSDVLRKREGLINALITSYDTYEELLGKSQKGLEFYKKLTHNVNQLLTRLRSTCQVQEEERAQLLAKQTVKAPTPVPTVVAKPEVAPSPVSESTTPKLKDYLPYMKNRSLARNVTPQVQVDPLPADTYYPDTFYPTSVRPTPVGSEDMSQMQLPDGVVAPMQNMQNPHDPYNCYGMPYGQKDVEPYSVPPNYAYPATSRTYEKLDDASNYGYNTPYTPPAFSTQVVHQQTYTNPYYTATQDNTTIVTDSQNAMLYNANSNVNQMNMNPSFNQYDYNNPYSMHSNQMGPIPEAVTTISAYSAGNQTELNMNFAQMQVSVPKTEVKYETPVNFGSDYSQTYYSVQYPNVSTSNMPTYSHATQNSSTNIVQSPLPSDMNSLNYQYSQESAASQYVQPGINQNVSTAYSGADPQYGYVTNSYGSMSQGYAGYTNAESTSTYSTISAVNMTPVSIGQSYNSFTPEPDKIVSSTVFSQLDALDKPIKSHVTGEALSSNVNFQPGYQNYDPNVMANYNPSDPNYQPNAVFPYQDQTNVSYPQSYQNHPGYTYNTSTGNYDYNYGSQNSYTSYENTEQQPNVDPQLMTKDPNCSAHNVYTNAGACETVQSPSEGQNMMPPTTVEQASDNQTYYNVPYGYQTTMQSNEVVTTSLPDSTNYGANMNQSTYMQSGLLKNTNVTFTNNNQVSTPKQNPPEPPNYDQNADNAADVNSQEPIPIQEVPQESQKTKPVETKPEQKTEISTFDLLSDIDFTIEQTPLTPEIKVPQISESAIRKPIIPKPEPIAKPVPEEKIVRPAKRDLFSDPSLLNQFTQEVKNLQKLVDSLTNKTAGGLTVLDAKWKTLQDIQAKENMSRSKSVAVEHSSSNIVAEVVPYDDSRLTLKSDPKAYINASYYKQLSPWCIPLVIAKNPAEKEHSTFWRAILENGISYIVCLLSEIEMQGQSYWPTAKGQSMELSRGLKVTLDEVTCTVHWTERQLSVCTANSTLYVKHYQINVFPAKIVCSPLVLLVDKILSGTYNNRQSFQLLNACIQCADGAGRSSVVALLLATMCHVRAGQTDLSHMLDIGCINLYKHRTNILEDTKYLADAYRTVLFYVQGVLCSGTTMFNGETVSIQSGASILPLVTPTPASAVPSTTNPKPNKFSRESFEEMKQSPGLKSGDMKDPLNFLDPLWSLKKK